MPAPRSGSGPREASATPNDGASVAPSDGVWVAGVWVIVVGGGSGRRFGGLKQYSELGGRRVIDRSIEIAVACSEGVIAVVPADRVDDPLPGVTTVVAGGGSRSGSVRAGLAAVPEEAEVILVHDAPRPMADRALFERVVEAVRSGADAVVPVIEVVDTIVHLDEGTLDRSRLRAVQTPQGFAAGALRAAHAGNAESTDDASLVERAGGRVVFVEGSTSNAKITEPFDLEVARLRLVLGGAEFPGSGPPVGDSPS